MTNLLLKDRPTGVNESTCPSPYGSPTISPMWSVESQPETRPAGPSFGWRPISRAGGENSWVRIPRVRLGPFARRVLLSDPKADKTLPDGPDRSDTGRFFCQVDGQRRLACISFGCCYGKPLDQLGPAARRFFRTLPLRLHRRDEEDRLQLGSGRRQGGSGASLERPGPGLVRSGGIVSLPELPLRRRGAGHGPGFPALASLLGRPPGRLPRRPSGLRLSDSEPGGGGLRRRHADGPARLPPDSFPVESGTGVYSGIRRFCCCSRHSGSSSSSGWGAAWSPGPPWSCQFGKTGCDGPFGTGTDEGNAGGRGSLSSFAVIAGPLDHSLLIAKFSPFFSMDSKNPGHWPEFLVSPVPGEQCGPAAERRPGEPMRVPWTIFPRIFTQTSPNWRLRFGPR